MSLAYKLHAVHLKPGSPDAPKVDAAGQKGEAWPLTGEFK